VEGGFRRIAIVNRGEPAMRLVNAVEEYEAAHDAGLTTIALYTDPDRRAMFVRRAHEAHHLGPATFIDGQGNRQVTYLDLDRLEDALVRVGAEAVWVGWGFVAERPEFVDLCERLGIVFIGPSAAVMRRLGDKITSKQVAEAAGVPVAPWSGQPVETVEEAHGHAERLGYPLLIKATAGGGGRGIRRVDAAADLEPAFTSARVEALNAFGNGGVFLETLVPLAKHIEVQIIGDRAGTVWAVGVRDCSVQRRNQKLLEEAPSPSLTPEQDGEVRDAAARLGAAAGYQNAGTVEFLFDPPTGRFSFMEVNARLQVEHPVTELTTGVDMVKLQLHVARGGLLDPEPPPTVGHAIEARVNAEDPDAGFAPSPGRLEMLRLPSGPGVRVDTGVEEGDEIAAEFDSMIAKVIAVGRDRTEALARLRRGLRDTAVVIAGGTSNKAFLQSLLSAPEVVDATADVAWVDRKTARGERTVPAHADVAIVTAAIDAHRERMAVEREQFRASALRGRPEVDTTVGRTAPTCCAWHRTRIA
jgi:acetyl/propionyl-CoA carboxylase alpha subunit